MHARAGSKSDGPAMADLRGSCGPLASLAGSFRLDAQLAQLRRQPLGPLVLGIRAGSLS
jgi:hypothetical protein